MKYKRFIWLVALILMTTTFYAYSQEDIVRLDNTVFDNPQRIAVQFDHDDHNEKAGLDDDCSTCHHVYDAGKLIKDESSEDSMCSECHALNVTPENTVPLRMAFHKRCKECHFGSDTGPVLCGECHIKKRGV